MNGDAASITKVSVTATSKQISRIAVAAVAIVTWFSISNHCALGALIAAHTQSATMQMHCHGSQPPPSKNGDGEMPCCKVLRATVTAEAKIPQITSKDFLPIQSWIAAELIFPDEMQIHSGSGELDTGPPFVGSFAESVLQQSILAHAPPFA